MSWIFGGPGVSVRVWVPREFSIDLRSSSGAMQIEEITGNVRARTGEAPIRVSGIEGDLQIKTGPWPPGCRPRARCRSGPRP